MHLVPDLFRIVEVDLVDLEQREIALAFLGAPDLAFHRIAGPETEAPDLARAHINIVGPWQIVRIWRAEEAEAVLKYFNDASAGDLDLARGKLLQYRKHQLLLAESARVLNRELLGKAQKLGWRLNFKVLQFHFLHGGRLLGRENGAGEPASRMRLGRVVALPLVLEGKRAALHLNACGPEQDREARLPGKYDIPTIAGFSIWKRRQRASSSLFQHQNGRTTTIITIPIRSTVGTSLIMRKKRALCGMRSASKSLRHLARRK